MAVDIANVTGTGDVTFSGASGALYSWSANPGNSEVSPTPNAFHVWSLSRSRWIRTAPGQAMATDAGELSIVTLIAALGGGGGGIATTGPISTISPIDDDEEIGTLPSDGLVTIGDDEDEEDTDLTQVVGATIGLATLIRLVATRAGPAVARAVATVIGGFASRGRALIRWNQLPAWIRNLLIGFGIAEGTAIVIEEITDIDIPTISDILPTIGGGGGGDPVAQMVEAMTVSTWRANGVQFHRLSDGRLAVRNKHGVWKIWRPKKPIVLFATGATDLPTLLRADRAINKQAKKIAAMLRSRGYKVARS